MRMFLVEHLRADWSLALSARSSGARVPARIRSMLSRSRVLAFTVLLLVLVTVPVSAQRSGLLRPTHRTTFACSTSTAPFGQPEANDVMVCLDGTIYVATQSLPSAPAWTKFTGGGSGPTIATGQVAYATSTDTLGGRAGFTFFTNTTWDGEPALLLAPATGTEGSLIVASEFVSASAYSGLMVNAYSDGMQRSVDLDTFDKDTPGGAGVSGLTITTGSTGLDLYAEAGAITIGASGAQPFTINRPTTAPTLSVAQFISGSGSAPAVSNTSADSCGTDAATIAGTDVTGVVTVGATSGTDCTLTFVNMAPTRRQCWANNESSAALVRAVYVDTLHSKLQGVFAAGALISYGCLVY